MIPSETDISPPPIVRNKELYKSEEPLIKVHSSSVNVGILSPSSLETDSGKWPRSDYELIIVGGGVKLTNRISVLLVSAVQRWERGLTMPRT